MACFEIRGRTALVTGGSAGIGLALTRQLLHRGSARVLVVGRDRGRLAEIEREGAGRVVPLQADLADAGEVDRLLAGLPHLAPELSLLFNNAGTQQRFDALRTDRRELVPLVRQEIATNLSSVAAVCLGALPLLARQPSAALVNVTSGLALAPKQSSPVYCATKAAVRSFTRSLRYQCEHSAPHIRLVEALPPLVDTDMTRGRGSGKISADACAEAILAGLQNGRSEIYVGKSRLLHAVMRVAPALGYRIMRNG